ncbi:LOW QUALITY PROTEIN: zonadhesin [Ctenodactylus gundi]
MASPIWTLVLLVGAAWGQGDTPIPVRPHNGSVFPALLTQCDFEDDATPLCDWSQVSTDDGDWIRTRGMTLDGISGAPGGYPNGEGHYLHMESSDFPQKGVAQLHSPQLWEQGPLCVQFAYHLFGLSWGAQLRLLLLTGTQGARPLVLWKHDSTQSPAWMPTSVTVPAKLTLPSQLVFEGTRGSTAYLDISLDAVSIRRGTCNRVCVMQACSFDAPDDLCGWSWVPTASGAKWTQRTGSSGQQGVGPDGDFSSPAHGSYMLLDPKNAKPGQRSALLSPQSPSAGCLTLSFQYTLRARAPGAGLLVQASLLGGIRKHTLFSGQPGPSWQPVSVNYTEHGQIQFTVVGLFGMTPEPAVAVDAVSIAPCGESFPQCDFEDSAHPFCDWIHTPGDNGHWAWGGKDLPTSLTDFLDGSSYGGKHYIYLETNTLSQAGQSGQLVSRPFCAPGDVCVEFGYHIYGLRDGATLKVLLESPAGSTPVSLWDQVGSQKPEWLNASISIPSGHQQPMRVIFEATQDSNTVFVAVSFIMISQGACRASVSTAHATKPPVVATGPSETIVSTETPISPSEKPVIYAEKSPVLVEKPIIPVEKFPTATGGIATRTENPGFSTEKPAVTMEKATIPAERPIILTEKPTVPSGNFTVPTENPTAPTENTTVLTERFAVPTKNHTAPSEESIVPAEELTVPCVNALSCNCFHNNRYYKLREKWLSPNCTERCHGWPGSHVESQLSQCGTHTVCQLRNGQYRCHPYDERLPGPATCLLYGDPHYVTFSESHIDFTCECTYVLAQPCHTCTALCYGLAGPLPPWSLEALSAELTLSLSGPSTYAGKFCGVCGNYDGDSSNDNLKPGCSPARDDELGHSWQVAKDEDGQCQKNQANLLPCASAWNSTMSGLGFCSVSLDSRRASEHAGSQVLLCASPCPQTCHLASDKPYSGRCVACECSEGFVLSGLRCIPRARARKQWHKPGCSVFCACQGTNRIHYQPWKCGAQEAHGLQTAHTAAIPKVSGWLPQGRVTLMLSGSFVLLYTNFGYQVHYNGSHLVEVTCPPKRSKAPVPGCPTTCLSLGNPKDCPAKLPCAEGCECRRGHVLLIHLPTPPTALACPAHNSYASATTASLALGPERHCQQHRMTVPYRPSKHLWVSVHGQQLYLITDFELVARFDGRNTAVISLLWGLCGNYDGPQERPCGAQRPPYQSIKVFGKSWKVKTEDALIQSGVCRPPQSHVVLGVFLQDPTRRGRGRRERGRFPRRFQCSLEQLALINSTQACGVRDPQRPSEACHQIVMPEPFQERHMLAVMAWPANTVYQSCMTPSPTSCAKLTFPREYKGPCVEGCACLPGYANSGTSLLMADCGSSATRLGLAAGGPGSHGDSKSASRGIKSGSPPPGSSPFQLGDSFVTEDCSQHCTGGSSAILLCEPFGCGWRWGDLHPGQPPWGVLPGRDGSLGRGSLSLLLSAWDSCINAWKS